MGVGGGGVKVLGGDVLVAVAWTGPNFITVILGLMPRIHRSARQAYRHAPIAAAEPWVLGTRPRMTVHYI